MQEAMNTARPQKIEFENIDFENIDYENINFLP
jgi:hypothetical protein